MSADIIARGLAARAAARLTAVRADAVLYNRPALTAWHAALANRASAPAKIAWLGDSITEGVNATGYGSRWVDRALASLRAAYPTPGVTGGVNYLSAYNQGSYSGGWGPQPFTATLTGNSYGHDAGWGFGGRCAVLAAAGDGFSYQVNASSFQIHYARANGFGTMSIQVDGGAVTTVSTSGTFGLQSWSSPALTPGTHTITISSAGGGSVYFCGLLVFNGDEAAGIQGFEAGHYGWKASGYAGAGSLVYQPLGLVAPQLVTVALGTNDYQAQTPIETYRSNLSAIVAAVRAQVPTASIALVMYARRGDVAVQPIGWDQYVRACYDVADADAGGINGASGVAVIDLSARLPNAALTGAVDALGIGATDRVHFLSKGHAVIGEMVAGAVRA